MKLGKREFCPIHRSMFCCGRKREQKKYDYCSAVRHVIDPYHPRGYRELRSPTEMKKLLARKIIGQKCKCGICGKPLTDCKDIVPDHIVPKGMGGARRDDHPDNVQATHRRCNIEKGSKRL